MILTFGENNKLHYTSRTNNDGKISIVIDKSSINREAFIDLTKDERITKIYFDSQDIVYIPWDDE